MTTLRIGLLPETTDQTLDVTINDNPYSLRVLWNERYGYFSLSILDADQSPILTNIKMVKNYPLISRFKDTRLPIGDFILVQERGTEGRPEYGDLNGNYWLYYSEPDEVVETSQPLIEVSAPMIGSDWDSGESDWDAEEVGGPSLWDQ